MTSTSKSSPDDALAARSPGPRRPAVQRQAGARFGVQADCRRWGGLGGDAAAVVARRLDVQIRAIR